MPAISTRYNDPPVRSREVITRSDIEALATRNQASVTIGARCTITDEARELALKLGIAVVYGEQKAKAAPAAARPAAASPTPQTASAPAGNGIIDAVVAVLHEMKITPSEDLIRQIVQGVNTALARPRS